MRRKSKRERRNRRRRRKRREGVRKEMIGRGRKTELWKGERAIERKREQEEDK